MNLRRKLFGRKQNRGGGKPTRLDTTTRVLRDAAVDSQRSRLPQMAAALAYRTIFGLLPMVVVALIGLKAFSSEEKLEEVVRNAISYSGLSGIAVDESKGGTLVSPPVPGTNPPSGNQAGAVASPPVSDQPPSPRALDDWIKGLVDRVKKISISAVGAVGLATLIYAAIAMLVEIERAFNQIYRVPRGRSWVRRITQYWTLLTLGPIALLATFIVGQQFHTWVERIAARSGISIGTGALSVSILGYATTVLISTGLLLLAYITVPNTRVRLLPALAGAFLGALLWEAGKWGFTLYVIKFSTGVARLYGALGLIPLFLLWVYITWAIVLFGLQVSYQLQHGRRHTRAQPLMDAGPTLVDPAAAITVMTAAVKAFQAGKPQDAPALAKATGLSEGVVRLVVSRMAERGLLNRIESAEGEEVETTYALSRPPGAIRAAEILGVGFELAGGDQEPEADAVVGRLRKMQIECVGEQSLADLAGLDKQVGRRTAGGSDNGETSPGAARDSSPRRTESATLQNPGEGASREK